MKIAALCSGGKDGSYALWRALEEGHEIVSIVSILPKNEDSWMFHKPNVKIIDLYAKTSNLPLIKKHTAGEKEKELEDLRKALKKLKIEGVMSGALASNYQRERIQKVCEDLNLKSLTPIWKMDPFKLLDRFSEEDFDIIITSVSAKGLDKKWLGRKIDKECIDDLKKLKKKIGLHPTGEGGEYETLTLDAPFFEKKIILTETSKEWSGDRGHLEITDAKLSSRRK